MPVFIAFLCLSIVTAIGVFVIINISPAVKSLLGRTAMYESHPWALPPPPPPPFSPNCPIQPTNGACSERWAKMEGGKEKGGTSFNLEKNGEGGEEGETPMV